VVLDAAGAVVGHAALELNRDGPTAEVGQAVVSPAHRGRGLLERLLDALDDAARARGLRSLCGQPVTSHTASQRAEDHRGSHFCGVSLAYSPSGNVFKALRPTPGAQRESLLLWSRYLTPPAAVTVHAPRHHRPILERLYGALGSAADWQPGQTSHGRGEIRVVLRRAWGFGEIEVQRVGADSAAEVRRALRDLCDTAGAEVVFLSLPLTDPGTPHLTAAAEAIGFFFSGLGIDFQPAGDVLRLQYLNCPCDCARLQIYSPLARELLAYVEAERQRVQQRV
jgi:hypothetical protein